MFVLGIACKTGQFISQPVWKFLYVSSYLFILSNHVIFICLPSSVPATIMIPPINTTVVSPNPAVFTCVADGVLTPVITWWMREPDNSLTQLSSDGVNVTTTEDDLDSRTRQSNLTILQPQPVDAAEYVCVASNELATDMASAVLTVYGRYSWSEPLVHN